MGDIARPYVKKALLVASDSAKPTGQLQAVQQSLTEAGVAFAVYDRFMQNPLSTLVAEGA